MSETYAPRPVEPMTPTEDTNAAPASDDSDAAPSSPVIPYRFEKTISTAQIVSRWRDLGAGEETGVEVSVAGRLMLLRRMGGAVFADLRDSAGSIQLFAQGKVTENIEGFSKLSLGDWVGATGEVMRTRRGELSVKVLRWDLLAKARRSFGDKWRGVTDVETRYRQREVDLWANPESREVLELRSRLVWHLRSRLNELGFVEVETPVLHPIPGGAMARPFITHHNALDADFYLRVAPELYLKRLVVGGFEKVFEIGRQFRNEGISPRHNPEFTMLELYQAYADYHDLMPLFENLVAGVTEDILGTTTITYEGRQLDLSPPWRRATLSELVNESSGLEVDVHTPLQRLSQSLADVTGTVPDPAWGPGKLLLELYEKTTEANLWGPVFVCDYPAEGSPLARRHRRNPDLVERFQPGSAGRELGNAFSELTDPDGQRRRFEAQAKERASGDEEAMALDEEYLRSLEHGLPPTAGLGLGIDRLAMLLTDSSNIREVIAFPT